MEYLWGFTIIVGPILLGLAILYGSIRYARRDRRVDAVSDEAARRVREDIAEEDDRAD